MRYALEAGYDYVLTINNDSVVSPDFLTRLVATAEANPRSIVGARINFLDDPRAVWSVGAYWDWYHGWLLHCGYGYERRNEAEVLAQLSNPYSAEMLTGCGTLVPTACYREVGLYDERWFPQYHADSEFVLRAARGGYRALVELRAVVWNDAANTSTCRNPFSRKSPFYWRPLLALHLRYCPKKYLLPSLLAFYAARYCPLLERCLRYCLRTFAARSQPSQQTRRAA